MARRGWADIPVEWLFQIVGRLPCRSDRQLVLSICRSWRKFLKESLALKECPPPPAPLPWLLLPTDPAPTLSCVLSQGKTHELVSHHAPPPARYFGSYDGTWVLAALNDPVRNVAINLTTGKTVDLPNQLHKVPWRNEMEIQLATFSLAPDAQSVAAGVFDFDHKRCIAFWRLGDRFASPVHHLDLAPWSQSAEVEDVIFHKEEFLFLTKREDLRVCAPVFSDNGDLQAKFELIAFSDGCDHRPGNSIIARYLVVSREKLLLVARYTQRDTPADGQDKKTTGFGVFEMKEGKDRLVPASICGGVVRRGNDHEWHQLPILDGRILFLGRGCSRAFEAGLYPGIDEGIYFADEDFFCGHEGRFSCGDNGRCSPTLTDIEHFFPMPVHSSSSYSCPIWVLPPGLQSDGDRRNLQEVAHLPGVVRNTTLRIEEVAGSGDEDSESDEEDGEGATEE